MKQLPLDKLKEYIVEPFTEEEMIPLILFRGNTTIGRARSLWNFICGLKESEVSSLPQATKLSRESDDLNHICGIHVPITRLGLESFLARILAANRDIDKDLGIREYIEYLTNGRLRFRLEPIPRYSRESARKWRYPYKKKKSEVLQIAEKELKEHLRQPIPSFYPFLSTEPTKEHDLLLAVHDAVPKGLPASHRDDVCQDLIVAVLDGKLSLDNLPDAVPQCIKQAYKDFPTKYGPLYLEMSLSKEDDNFTLADTLHEGNIRNHW